MAKATPQRDYDESLGVRAAWLHYAAGLTQAEVARRLNITSIKAHRLISWAIQNGVVKFSIEGDITECMQLELQLTARFGLQYCRVVPDLQERLPLRSLGIAGATFLTQTIKQQQANIIGVGHGRTLAAAVAALPHIKSDQVRFVSLLGGLTRNYVINPHDVIHRLAEKTGATTYVMPVPFFANTAADREVLLAQKGVSDVFSLANQADLMVVGIGNVSTESQLVISKMIKPSEVNEVVRQGGEGEMLGHFFNNQGQMVETSLAARTLSPNITSLAGKKIVAIAGGSDKISAIYAVLMSGYLSGLITDEQSALRLVGEGTS